MPIGQQIAKHIARRSRQEARRSMDEGQKIARNKKLMDQSKNKTILTEEQMKQGQQAQQELVAWSKAKNLKNSGDLVQTFVRALEKGPNDRLKYARAIRFMGQFRERYGENWPEAFLRYAGRAKDYGDQLGIEARDSEDIGYAVADMIKREGSLPKALDEKAKIDKFFLQMPPGERRAGNTGEVVKTPHPTTKRIWDTMAANRAATSRTAQTSEQAEGSFRQSNELLNEMREVDDVGPGYLESIGEDVQNVRSRDPVTPNKPSLWEDVFGPDEAPPTQFQGDPKRFPRVHAQSTEVGDVRSRLMDAYEGLRHSGDLSAPQNDLERLQAGTNLDRLSSYWNVPMNESTNIPEWWAQSSGRYFRSLPEHIQETMMGEMDPRKTGQLGLNDLLAGKKGNPTAANMEGGPDIWQGLRDNRGIIQSIDQTVEGSPFRLGEARGTNSPEAARSLYSAIPNDTDSIRRALMGGNMSDKPLMDPTGQMQMSTQGSQSFEAMPPAWLRGAPEGDETFRHDPYSIWSTSPRGAVKDIPEGMEDQFQLAQVNVDPKTPGVMMRSPQSVYSPLHGTENIWGPRRMNYSNQEIISNPEPINPYAPDDELQGQVGRVMSGEYAPRQQVEFQGDKEAYMRRIDDLLRQLDSQPGDPLAELEAKKLLDELEGDVPTGDEWEDLGF